MSEARYPFNRPLEPKQPTTGRSHELRKVDPRETKDLEEQMLNSPRTTRETKQDLGEMARQVTEQRQLAEAAEDLTADAVMIPNPRFRDAIYTQRTPETASSMTAKPKEKRHTAEQPSNWLENLDITDAKALRQAATELVKNQFELHRLEVPTIAHLETQEKLISLMENSIRAYRNNPNTEEATKTLERITWKNMQRLAQEKHQTNPIDQKKRENELNLAAEDIRKTLGNKSDDEIHALAEKYGIHYVDLNSVRRLVDNGINDKNLLAGWERLKKMQNIRRAA